MSVGGKKVLVDKFAEMALFDSAENQRVALQVQSKEAEKKLAMRRALDEQVRVKQQAIIREREAEKQWVLQEQERIKVWNKEERSKIQEQREKEEAIRVQREKQLRELHLLREREKDEHLQYEMGILKSIHSEMKHERAVEMAKKAADADNLRQVAVQNLADIEARKKAKADEATAMRALEAQWSELLDKQERARDRQLKATYARQAIIGKAARSHQEEMALKAAADEERANQRMKQDEIDAENRVQATKAWRASLQAEALDMLSLQVREKQVRMQAERERDAMVATREASDMKAAAEAEARRRQMSKARNMAYAQQLDEQRQVQAQRKLMEPFLMSKAERQMNASLLRRLPAD